MDVLTNYDPGAAQTSYPVRLQLSKRNLHSALIAMNFRQLLPTQCFRKSVYHSRILRPACRAEVAILKINVIVLILVVNNFVLLTLGERHGHGHVCPPAGTGAVHTHQEIRAVRMVHGRLANDGVAVYALQCLQ